MKIAPMEDISLPCDRVVSATQRFAHEDAFLQAQVVKHRTDHLGCAP
jgi:hypothetical protein